MAFNGEIWIISMKRPQNINMFSVSVLKAPGTLKSEPRWHNLALLKQNSSVTNGEDVKRRIILTDKIF
jgi:hypothetical protein